MIKCSNCGELAPVGAATCRRCGLPLSSVVGRAAEYEKVAPQQPELPAWLESLRAGEGPAPSGTGPMNFSAADLIDEGNLPSWMSPDQRSDITAEHKFPSGSQAPWNPALQAGPDAAPAQGIAAGSLIDEQSLPSWMRGGQEAQGSSLAGSAGEPSLQGQKDIPASSLVQPDALPDWMKSLEPRQAAGSASEPVRPSAQGGLEASSLLQPDALPEWMKTLEPQQPPPSPQSAAPEIAPAPAPPSFTHYPEQGGSMQPISAHDLIDPQQLPGWMTGREQEAAPAPAPAAPVASGEGLKASSLLDMNALPPWLRENQQESAPAAMNAPREQAEPAPTGGPLLAAPSLIDMNALPEWLREAANTQGSGGYQGAGAPPASAAPGMAAQRVENMRVPSRPRGEMEQNEQSEAAANVFASMLGVASAAPRIPQQPGASQAAPNARMPQEQEPPTLPQASQPGAQPALSQPGLSGQGQGMTSLPGQAAPNMPSYPGIPPSPAGYPPSYPQGNQPPASPAYPMGAQNPLAAGQQARSAGKRSFLDVIRSWFH